MDLKVDYVDGHKVHEKVRDLVCRLTGTWGHVLSLKITDQIVGNLHESKQLMHILA